MKDERIDITMGMVRNLNEVTKILVGQLQDMIDMIEIQEKRINELEKIVKGEA